MRQHPAVLIFASAFFSLVLTACGGGNSSSSPSTTASSPAPPASGSQPGSGSGNSNSGGSGSGSAGSGTSSGSGSGPGTGSVGSNLYVYAGDNQAIAGFSVATDGSAVPVPGSPFSMAAAAMVADPHGNFLFGESSNLSGPLNPTSNAYFSYAVAGNGALTQAAIAPPLTDPNSPNVQPTYLGWLDTDRAGSTLYGLQVEASGNNWIGVYQIGGNGTLAGAQANPGMGQTEISFTPDDHFGYVVYRYRADGLIWEYSRNTDGTLTLDPRSNTGRISSPPPGSKARPQFLQVSPTGNYVAVILSDTSTANSQTGLAVYPINTDGTLGTSTPLLVFSPAQKYQPILTWDASGKYIFVSYFNGIATYRYNAETAQLIPIEAELNSAVSPTDMAFLDAHLFAVNYDNPYLFIYNFDSTTERFTVSASNRIALGFNPTSVAALQH